MRTVPTYLHIYIPTYLHSTYYKTAVSGKDKAPVDPAAQGAKWVRWPLQSTEYKICSTFFETEYLRNE